MRRDENKVLALTAMAANFGTDIPEPLLELWLDLLRPYSAFAVSQAVKQVVMECASPTMPPFAVLRRALDTVTGTGPDALDMQAAAEWDWLLEVSGNAEGGYPPTQAHPTTAFVVSLFGGWEAVRAWPEKTVERMRGEFIHHWTECHGNVNSHPHSAAGFTPSFRLEDALSSTLGVPGIAPGVIADCGGLQ